MEHDFDFVFGSWHIHNRKRRDDTEPAADDWVEFSTTSRTEPVLAGFSHLERIHAGPESPGGSWEGLTLRQFDPHDGLWRIWWASTKRPGRLDPSILDVRHRSGWQRRRW